MFHRYTRFVPQAAHCTKNFRQTQGEEHMIETILAVFAVGFLGVAVGIGVVCLMVWMALNED
jgi:hypothetical protein